MTRARWIVVALLLAALDVYLLGWRLTEVQGNVEAQFLIVTPQVLGSHLLHQRAAERRHRELLDAHRQPAPPQQERP